MSHLSKLHTYNEPTNGSAWVAEAKRLLAQAYESPHPGEVLGLPGAGTPPGEGVRLVGPDKLAKAARQADELARKTEDMSDTPTTPRDHWVQTVDGIWRELDYRDGEPMFRNLWRGGHDARWEPWNFGTNGCEVGDQWFSARNHGAGTPPGEAVSIFGTPPESIPEGAVEFVSEGMRALRFLDSEGRDCSVRIAASDRFQAWDSWADRPADWLAFGSIFDPAAAWLRHWMANYSPLEDAPISKALEKLRAGGFLGKRGRVLWEAADESSFHLLRVVEYHFEGSPPVPYVEVEESPEHSGAPARIYSFSAAVHALQNLHEDEVWTVGNRETSATESVREDALGLVEAEWPAPAPWTKEPALNTQPWPSEPVAKNKEPVETEGEG